MSCFSFQDTLPANFIWVDCDSYDVDKNNHYGVPIHRLQGQFFRVCESGMKIPSHAPLIFWDVMSKSIQDYQISGMTYTFWIPSMEQDVLR